MEWGGDGVRNVSDCTRIKGKALRNPGAGFQRNGKRLYAGMRPFHRYAERAEKVDDFKAGMIGAIDAFKS